MFFGERVRNAALRNEVKKVPFSRCIGHLLPVICGGSAEDVGAQLIEFHGGHPPWFLRTPMLDIGDTLRLDPDSSSNSAQGKAISFEFGNLGLPDVHTLHATESRGDMSTKFRYGIPLKCMS